MCWTRITICVFSALTLLGCSPGKEGQQMDDAATGSTSGDATGTSNEGEGESESSESMEPTETTTEEDGSSEETTGSELMCPPEADDYPCSPQLQDCPDGLKCVLWDTDEDFGPDASICAPPSEAPVQLYEACENDEESCSDNCGAEALCVPYYGDGGACMHTCNFYGDEDTCPVGTTCFTCENCWVDLCAPNCNPIDPQCPENLPTCMFNGYVDGFACTSAIPAEGELGDDCTSGEACAPDLWCASAETLGPSCEHFGCCSELCDTSDTSFTCSDPLHECIALFAPGEGLEGQETLGVCGLPEFDPCQTPGACPPPDVESTYPWCSAINDSLCPEPGFSAINGQECYSDCWCFNTCESAADCADPDSGTATPTCEAPWGDMQDPQCLLRCDQDTVCPNGMECSSSFGESICTWRSDVAPEDC